MQRTVQTRNWAYSHLNKIASTSKCLIPKTTGVWFCLIPAWDSLPGVSITGVDSLVCPVLEVGYILTPDLKEWTSFCLFFWVEFFFFFFFRFLSLSFVWTFHSAGFCSYRCLFHSHFISYNESSLGSIYQLGSTYPSLSFIQFIWNGRPQHKHISQIFG